jgi:hypothetical protein
LLGQKETSGSPPLRVAQHNGRTALRLSNLRAEQRKKTHEGMAKKNEMTLTPLVFFSLYNVSSISVPEMANYAIIGP